VPTTMGTTCYFSPERFEPDAHAEPSLGVDEEVVRLDVEVHDAAGVQMEEAHEAPRITEIFGIGQTKWADTNNRFLVSTT
jgi:hypothetical protein